MISANQLFKFYGETCIIHGRSDRFPETGFYLLLGESGSGKTTYLNVLYGLVPFEEGTVIINGTEYSGRVDTSAMSHIAEYITQDAYFVEFLTIKENLMMVSENEEEIFALAERFSLKEQLNQHPNSLSGGERQRFAVVRALLRKKRILFLDEPTASLDEANKKEVFSLLKELKNEVLILCASHDKMAELYADEVISFSKDGVEEKVLPGINAPVTPPNRKRRSVPNKNAHGKNPWPWLLKYFRQNKKHKTESLIFILFLMTAFCLAMYADIPKRKMDITRDSLYRWNTLSVYVTGFHRWEEMNLSDNRIREVVLNYAKSCPDGNEDVDLDNEMGTLPEYELDDVLTLPADEKMFRLSDRIIYGSYFTDKDQILLTYEMAEQMSPSDISVLVGKHLTKEFYGIGPVDMTIVGILGRLNENEKAYMDQFTSNRNWYSEVYFVNARFTQQFETDKNFYNITRNNGKRVYDLYFDSYMDLKDYMEEYDSSGGDNCILFTESGVTDVQMHDLLDRTFPVLLPLAALLTVMSILFYIQVRRIEYDHKHQFISVFEYSGYDKKKVTSSFVLLNVLDLAVCCMIAEMLALLIAAVVNLINRSRCIISMVVFTYNPLILGGFTAGILILGSIITCILYRRVTVLSWYEDLIDTRDLI